MPERAASHIFHVTFATDWAGAEAAGEYRISTRDSRFEDVGFIHAGFADQYVRVGSRIFADAIEPLVVLVIDSERVGVPVQVEDLHAEGEAFPHIYGPLPLIAVVEVLPARIIDGALVVDGA